MKLFKSLSKIFGKIDPIEVATNELLEARLALMQAESGVEYSTALVEFNKKRVYRLETMLNKGPYVAKQTKP